MAENKKCCHYNVCRYVHAAHQYGEQCSCESCIHNAHSYVSDDLMEQVKSKRLGYQVAAERYREGFNDALLKIQSMLHNYRGARK